MKITIPEHPGRFYDRRQRPEFKGVHRPRNCLYGTTQRPGDRFSTGEWVVGRRQVFWSLVHRLKDQVAQRTEPRKNHREATRR
jgi:hypothetical protein